MPRPRKRAHRRRRTYGRQHVFQLLTGRDYFNDSFGCDLDAMREAWPVLRAQVCELLAERRLRGHTRSVPWAAEQFGEPVAS